MKSFVPRLEGLEARLAPSGPTTTIIVNGPADPVVVSRDPPPDQGYAPGLGGSGGGSGDRGAPPGIVGD